VVLAAVVAAAVVLIAVVLPVVVVGFADGVAIGFVVTVVTVGLTVAVGLEPVPVSPPQAARIKVRLMHISIKRVNKSKGRFFIALLLSAKFIHFGIFRGTGLASGPVYCAGEKYKIPGGLV
jgi:hypothetical protein